MVPFRLRVVALADTHLGFDYPLRPRIVRPRRGEDFFANFARVLEHAAAVHADLVVHGGDVFFRSRVDARFVTRAYRMMRASADAGLTLAVVPGNHERSRLPRQELLDHPRIHVFDRPRAVSLEVRGTPVAIAGFPFERDAVRERFPALLEESGWRSLAEPVRLLVMHQAVEGATVGVQNYTFRTGPDVVRMCDVPPDATAVLCGHIHRLQVLWRRTADGRAVPVVYPGSVERTSYAERGEAKGFFEIEIVHDGERCRAVPRARALPTRPIEPRWRPHEVR